MKLTCDFCSHRYTIEEIDSHLYHHHRPRIENLAEVIYPEFICAWPGEDDGEPPLPAEEISRLHDLFRAYQLMEVFRRAQTTAYEPL